MRTVTVTDHKGEIIHTTITFEGPSVWHIPQTQPQWQPIETAPKDVNILAFDSGIIGEAYFFNGEWWLAVTEYNYGDTILKPAHWMPLPEPPK